MVLFHLPGGLHAPDALRRGPRLAALRLAPELVRGPQRAAAGRAADGPGAAAAAPQRVGQGGPGDVERRGALEALDALDALGRCDRRRLSAAIPEVYLLNSVDIFL